MRVLICSGQRLFAESLSVALEGCGATVTGVATTPAEALRMVDRAATDVCLMDLDGQGSAGLEGSQQILAKHAGTRVILLSAGMEPSAVSTAIAFGVTGFARHEMTVQAIFSTIERVHAKEVVIDPLLLRGAVSHRKGPLTEGQRLAEFLTPREREVLERLVAGQNTRAIAAAMEVTFSTARTHIQNVLAKLGVHSRLEAAAMAVGQHVVEPRYAPSADALHRVPAVATTLAGVGVGEPPARETSVRHADAGIAHPSSRHPLRPLRSVRTELVERALPAGVVQQPRIAQA